MAEALRARSSRRGIPLALGALLALPAGAARAQSPLFAFAQLSDIQVNEPVEAVRFEQVLETIASAGQPGALLPHAIAMVFLAGDLVDLPNAQSEWVQLAHELDQELTDQGIPFLAVPGNHDQNEFGAPNYEQHVASAGVWDVASDALRGHNGLETATGWRGLRFLGINSSHAGQNTVRASDLAQAQAIASAATAAGENVFVVSHHPHNELGAIPLAGVLELPGVIGYMRGHTGVPHATQGLAGIANPVWDLSSESVLRDAALLYYEVYPSEVRAYVLKLVTSPVALPPPAILALAHPLAPAPAPSAPAADFAALPASGRAVLEVAFADLSAAHPSEWHWDFGDASTSEERHPRHRYEAAGVYDVSLVASNAQGSDARTHTAAVEVLPPPPSATFTPVADARVSSASPNQNYGQSQTFRARQSGSATEQSYLRFAVSGVGAGSVVGALLRLYVTDPSMDGGTISAAPGGWDEASLTWENAPGVGTLVLDSAATAFPDSWVEFDVSALVQGNGIFDFGLSSASSNSVIYSSREGQNPPQLVVFTAPALSALGPAARALAAALVAALGARSLGRAR